MLGIQHTILGVIGRTKYRFLDRNYIQTIRFVLITACLLLTAVSGVLVVNRPVFGFMLIGGIAGLCATIFVYRHMEISCLLILVVSTVWTIGIGSGTGTPIMLSLVLLVLLAGLWLLKLLIVERSFQSVRSLPVNWPFLLFSITVIISLFWGAIYVEEPIRLFMNDKLLPRLMTALVIIISPLAAIMFANLVRSIKAIKFFTWWFIIYGGLVIVLRFLGILPTFFNTFGQLPVWVSILAVGQAMFNNQLPRYVRIILLAMAATWLYIQFGLQRTWVSGWLPLAVGMVGMVFWYSRKLFVLGVIIVCVYILANLEMFSETIDAENQESGQTRVEAWDRTLRVVKDHFLFGTGPAGYYFYLYIYVGGFFQLSHNNYVDVIAQTGIVGFIFYIGIWIGFGWMALKTYWIAPVGGFRQGLAVSLLVCYPVTLVVMMLGDWVLPFTYTQTLGGINYTIWPWLLQGISMALYFEMLGTNSQTDKSDLSHSDTVSKRSFNNGNHEAILE